MTHRRVFLKQLAAIAGASGLGRLQAIDLASTEELARDANSDDAGLASLRDRYLLSPDIIYLNHGSIGTIPRVVMEARSAYLDLCETNPWLYMWGGAWEEPREAVRASSAALLGCQATEVSFTHNTTEGFNTLAGGLALGPGDEVLFSSLSHAGAAICWHHYAETRGFVVRTFDFPILDIPNMTADDVLNAYDRNITPATRVLVFPHVDNIVGLRYPVKELAALAKSKGVEIVAVDGAQTVGMIEVDTGELGVDVYCTSSHKWLQAPKGLGLMYVRQDLQDDIRPIWVTWGQDRWRGTARIFEDYGTRNLAEVLSLGDAIEFQNSLGAEAKESRYRELWETFRAATEESDRVTWRSPTTWEMSASLYAIEIGDIASQAAFNHMYEKHGFVFRPFAAQGLNTVRISPNIYNTDEEIERFFAVAEALPRS